VRVGAIAVAGGIGFLLALAYVFTSARDARLPVVERSTHAPPATSNSESSPALLPGRAASESARVRADADGWSPRDMPAKVAQRLREAKDKRVFFDRALEVGGGAYLHFALEALQRCRVVNEYGMVGAEQDVVARIPANDPAQSRRLEAYRAFIRGCEGFALRSVTGREESAIVRRIYESNDAVAKAYNLRSSSDAAAEYDGRATAVELLESGDAYLIQIIVPYLATNGETAAWNWALCELGLDCSATGAYGNLQCFAVGKCDWKALEDVAEPLFGAGGAAPAASRKDEIVAAVRARDWAKLL